MTFDYYDTIPGANTDLLDSELRAVFAGMIAGISYSDPNVTVHFLTEPTANDLLLAAATIDSHNPAGLTPAQQLAAMATDAQTATVTSELRHITPAQAEAWVQNNVNDLATAKTVLKKMARVLAYLMLHAELRGE